VNTIPVYFEEWEQEMSIVAAWLSFRSVDQLIGKIVRQLFSLP
jgi:hypothetical protein